MTIFSKLDKLNEQRIKLADEIEEMQNWFSENHKTHPEFITKRTELAFKKSNLRKVKRELHSVHNSLDMHIIKIVKKCLPEHIYNSILEEANRVRVEVDYDKKQYRTIPVLSPEEEDIILSKYPQLLNKVGEINRRVNATVNGLEALIIDTSKIQEPFEYSRAAKFNKVIFKAIKEIKSIKE